VCRWWWRKQRSKADTPRTLRCEHGRTRSTDACPDPHNPRCVSEHDEVMMNVDGLRTNLFFENVGMGDGPRSRCVLM
jgi:hypothetical protein